MPERLPCAGAVTTAKLSASPSASVPESDTGNGRVLLGADALARRNRRVVARRHRDADGAEVRVAATVVDLERETVGAVEVGRRRIGHRRQRAAQRPVLRSRDDAPGQRVPVGVNRGGGDRDVPYPPAS